MFGVDDLLAMCAMLLVLALCVVVMGGGLSD